MFNPVEYSSRLSKLIIFNRFLSGILIFNLLIYTFQINTKENSLTGLLILSCWLSILVYASFNEIIRQIIKKSMIATPEVCYVLTQVNAVLTAALVTVITFCTGNVDFMILYLIPVFTGLFYSRIKFSVIMMVIGTVILFVADITGWLKSQALIVNQDIFIPVSLAFSSIMGLMLYLGITFSNYLRNKNANASMLHNMATTDALTGLINRREFNKRISEEVSRAKRHKSSLSLALFDIDHFKRINDTYGHLSGDAILQELGELILENTRDCDVSARYGGEEFALILPETALDEAFELLERLRILIHRHNFTTSCGPINVSISVGLAQFDYMDGEVAEFCERTDKALYQAKRNGRNRVEYSKFTLPKLDLSRILVAQIEK